MRGREVWQGYLLGIVEVANRLKWQWAGHIIQDWRSATKIPERMSKSKWMATRNRDVLETPSPMMNGCKQ